MNPILSIVRRSGMLAIAILFLTSLSWPTAAQERRGDELKPRKLA